MSDARTRALEAAAQRGEPGAAEALARARHRVTAPCDLCCGSRRVPALDEIAATAQAVRRGLIDHAVASAMAALTKPCPACTPAPVDPPREWIACTVCEGRGVLFTGPDPSDEILCQACRGSGDER